MNVNLKYQQKDKNQHLDLLIDPSFQGVNRIFVLSFKGETQRTSYKRYYLPTVEIKCYNVMIDRKNFFDQPVKHKLMTYDNIRKIATGQGDDYTTSWLLDYHYFKNYSQQTFVGLQDVLKTSSRYVLKTSSTRLQHNNFSSFEDDALEDENLLR